MDVKRSSGNSFFGILILMFFLVGIPALVISKGTESKENRENHVEKVSGSKNVLSMSTVDGAVIDRAGIFSAAGKSELNRFLVDLNDTKGVQIAVVTVPGLEGQDIESFSMECAEQLKLGKKGLDNGALLVVAMKEHKVRIETGYGTEGVLTDAKCSRIIRNIIAPAFRNGRFEEGIIESVRNMAGIITSDESLVSEGVNNRKKSDEDGGFALLALPFVIFILFCILSGGRRRGGMFFFPMFFGGRGGGHSGGFGGGSGGFSGGGGGFGGGGASGGW